MLRTPQNNKEEGARAKKLVTGPLGRGQSVPFSAQGAYCSAPEPKLELELIQTQMTQKPMLRADVYARALRASQNRKEDSV